MCNPVACRFLCNYPVISSICDPEMPSEGNSFPYAPCDYPRAADVAWRLENARQLELVLAFPNPGTVGLFEVQNASRRIDPTLSNRENLASRMKHINASACHAIQSKG
jgi:hypothetical protein